MVEHSEDPKSEQINLGVTAFKNGKFVIAEKIFLKLLQSDSEHELANYYLGLLHHQKGEFTASIPFFKNAIKDNPNCLEYWVNLLSAYLQNNDMETAMDTLAKASETTNTRTSEILRKLDEYTRAPTKDEYRIIFQSISADSREEFNNKAEQLLVKYPLSYELRNLLGVLLEEIGDRGEAIKSLTYALYLTEKPTDALNNLASLALKDGNLNKAMNYIARVINFDENNPEALNNLGRINHINRNYETALLCFEKAVASKPDFSDAYNNKGLTHISRHEPKEAIKCFSAAIELNASNFQAHNNLGNTLFECNEFESSKQHFHLALEKKSNFLPAYVNLCNLLEKTNDVEGLKANLEKAKKTLGSIPDELSIFMMILAFREGRYVEAEKQSKTINIVKLHVKYKLYYYSFTGRIFDKLEKFDEAYISFKRMNELALANSEYKNSDVNNYLNFHAATLDKLRSSDLMAHNVFGSAKQKNGFLIGFPRSGTTLLDTILRSHSQVDVIEEKPVLSNAIQNIDTISDYDFIEHFPTKIERTDIIDSYLGQLKEFSNIDQKRMIIDKLPLNILQLHKISYLFPGSKIICMVRHPLDCLMSNWMQNYKLNLPMATMLELTNAVELYALAMKYFVFARDHLNLKILTVRYEDLLENFEQEVSRILQFLGLNWEEEVKQFQNTARMRERIQTPSYLQVIQPIYTSSINRWQNYEKYLAPHLEKISPWLLEFGYEHR